MPYAHACSARRCSSRGGLCRYRGYAEYQASVSRFFPLPPLPADAAAKRPPMNRVDAAFIAWFVLGTAITYLIDIEQVLIANSQRLLPP